MEVSKLNELRNLPSSTINVQLDFIVVYLAVGTICRSLVLDHDHYYDNKKHRFHAIPNDVKIPLHNHKYKLTSRVEPLLLIGIENGRHLSNLLYGVCWQRIYFRDGNRFDYRRKNIIILPNELFMPHRQYPHIKGFRMSTRRICVQSVFDDKEKNFPFRTDGDNIIIIEALEWQMQQLKLCSTIQRDHDE